MENPMNSAVHLSPNLYKGVGDNNFGFEEFIQYVYQHGLNIQSVCVRQHNEILGRFDWWDGRRANVNSVSKSVLSMALGMAIEEGFMDLDEKLVDIFPEMVPTDASDNLRSITVKHLITMSPGYDGYILPGWQRDWEPDKDWAHYCMNFPVAHEPGKRFIYNNASPILVSRAIQKRTGETLLEWLKPRLFDPLEIPNPQWFTCPLGYTLGAGGLFLDVDEMSRLGQLCLDNGKWRGKQLIPEWYMKEATVKQIDNSTNPETSCLDETAGYGYFFWMMARPESFMMLGMYGQMVYVFRDLDAVVTCASHLEIDEQEQVLHDAVKQTILPKLK